MAGIYIHIPYCTQACHYCDFHFSTNLKTIDPLINSILTEIEERKGELDGHAIETIYFGGGTPSILAPAMVESILSKLENTFHLNVKELTLEANPEDLDHVHLQELMDLGVSRLSIGIQSFDDSILTFLNRAHNGRRAEECVVKAKEIGFKDITADLIYGIQNTTLNQLEYDIGKMVNLPVNHISAYNLTVEENTVFGRNVASGKIQNVDDEYSRSSYELLTLKLRGHGFEHYEVSNFAKDGNYALHNTNYWKRKPYIGFGPGAHSFIEKKRRWNISNNVKYIEALNNSDDYSEYEDLTPNDIINERILTGLRTMWGCNHVELLEDFGFDLFKENSETIAEYVHNQWLEVKENSLTLTNKGKLFADKIAAELFII